MLATQQSDCLPLWVSIELERSSGGAAVWTLRPSGEDSVEGAVSGGESWLLHACLSAGEHRLALRPLWGPVMGDGSLVLRDARGARCGEAETVRAGRLERGLLVESGATGCEGMSLVPRPPGVDGHPAEMSTWPVALATVVAGVVVLWRGRSARSWGGPAPWLLLAGALGAAMAWWLPGAHWQAPLLTDDGLRDMLVALKLWHGETPSTIGPELHGMGGHLGRLWYTLLMPLAGLGSPALLPAVGAGLRAMSGAAVLWAAVRTGGVVGGSVVAALLMFHASFWGAFDIFTHQNLLLAAVALWLWDAHRAFVYREPQARGPMMLWAAAATQLHLTAVALPLVSAWWSWQGRGALEPVRMRTVVLAASVPFWPGLPPLLRATATDGIVVTLSAQLLLWPALGLAAMVAHPRAPWVGVRRCAAVCVLGAMLWAGVRPGGLAVGDLSLPAALAGASTRAGALGGTPWEALLPLGSVAAGREPEMGWGVVVGSVLLVLGIAASGGALGRAGRASRDGPPVMRDAYLAAAGVCGLAWGLGGGQARYALVAASLSVVVAGLGVASAARMGQGWFSRMGRVDRAIAAVCLVGVGWLATAASELPIPRGLWLLALGAVWVPRAVEGLVLALVLALAVGFAPRSPWLAVESAPTELRHAEDPHAQLWRDLVRAGIEPVCVTPGPQAPPWWPRAWWWGRAQREARGEDAVCLGPVGALRGSRAGGLAVGEGAAWEQIQPQLVHGATRLTGVVDRADGPLLRIVDQPLRLPARRGGQVDAVDAVRWAGLLPGTLLGSNGRGVALELVVDPDGDEAPWLWVAWSSPEASTCEILLESAGAGPRGPFKRHLTDVSDTPGWAGAWFALEGELRGVTLGVQLWGCDIDALQALPWHEGPSDF